MGSNGEKLTDVEKQMDTSQFKALLILVSRTNSNHWRHVFSFPLYDQRTAIFFSLLCSYSVCKCVCKCACAHVFHSGGVDGVEWRGGVPFLSMWANAGTEIHPTDEICSTTHSSSLSLCFLIPSILLSVCNLTTLMWVRLWGGEKKNFRFFQRPQTGKETFEDISCNGVWVSGKHRFWLEEWRFFA